MIGLMMVNNNLVGGWPEPLWKMMEFVNGVGMKINKMFDTTNQLLPIFAIDG